MWKKTHHLVQINSFEWHNRDLITNQTPADMGWMKTHILITMCEFTTNISMVFWFC